MAGLRACLVALALTTSSGFAPSLQTGAARGRPSLKSYWRLHLEHSQRLDAAARHGFVKMKPCARPRRAGPLPGRRSTPSPQCRASTAWPHAIDATSARTGADAIDESVRVTDRPPPAGQVALHGYVPSGMTPEAYAAMKKKEEADRKKKQFGKGGARGFESRSMQSFVAGLERGETKHLFPVNPAKVRTGEIALKDVPYMQRGGSWTNSDLTQKKKGWMNTVSVTQRVFPTMTWSFACDGVDVVPMRESTRLARNAPSRRVVRHGLRHERVQRRQGQGPEGQ